MNYALSKIIFLAMLLAFLTPLYSIAKPTANTSTTTTAKTHRAGSTVKVQSKSRALLAAEDRLASAEVKLLRARENTEIAERKRLAAVAKSTEAENLVETLENHQKIAQTAEHQKLRELRSQTEQRQADETKVLNACIAKLDIHAKDVDKQIKSLSLRQDLLETQRRNSFDAYNLSMSATMPDSQELCDAKESKANLLNIILAAKVDCMTAAFRYASACIQHNLAVEELNLAQISPKTEAFQNSTNGINKIAFFIKTICGESKTLTAQISSLEKMHQNIISMQAQENSRTGKFIPLKNLDIVVAHKEARATFSSSLLDLISALSDLLELIKLRSENQNTLNNQTADRRAIIDSRTLALSTLADLKKELLSARFEADALLAEWKSSVAN